MERRSGSSSVSIRDTLFGNPITSLGQEFANSMEKNEKILASKQRNIRIAFGSVFVAGCIVLLWTLLTMEDDAAAINTTVISVQEDQKFRHNPLLIPTKEQEESNIPVVVIAPTHAQKVDPAVEAMMVEKVSKLDRKVRDIKDTGVLMEVDEKGLAASKELQAATRDLLHYRYGPREPYHIKLDLKFQPSNPTFETMGETDSFVIELAPSALVPHSIFSFLEIARHFHEKKGAFHRRAGHVLQVAINGNQVPHLAFQEYSPKFPHVKGTVGYAGRPSGPAFYVSIQDNSKNHGPGSQQHHNPYEADSCFGKVVEGFEDVVLKRITKMPGEGFLKKPMHVFIDAMTIMVPDANGAYTPWHAAN
jgi:hypothetical protein